MTHSAPRLVYMHAGKVPMCIHRRAASAGERTPGSSDYKADSITILPGKPAYTIAGRQSHASPKHRTPGPGAYAVLGNSKTIGTHPNAPGYSMPASGRPALQSHRLPGPGGKPHPPSPCIVPTMPAMLPAPLKQSSVETCSHALVCAD